MKLQIVFIILIVLNSVLLAQATEKENRFLEAMSKREKSDFIGAKNILEKDADNDPKAKYYLGVLAEENVAGLHAEQADLLEKKACTELFKKSLSKLDHSIAGQCYADGFGVNKDEMKSKQYHQMAYEAIQMHAKKGNLWAQRMLAVYKERGRMGEVDKKSAAEIYRKVCEQGSGFACHALGSLFYNGDQIEKNLEKANYFYEKGCELGNPLACTGLGEYQKGNDAYNRQDYVSALEMYTREANRGNAKAQSEVGSMYYSGLGTPSDISKAVYWYKMSAQQGYSMGQYNLGLMYENGIGVSKDIHEAEKLYKLATTGGSKEAPCKLAENWEILDYDRTYARSWLKLCVERGGNADRQYRLAIEESKMGGDLEEASKLFLLAAKNGNVLAELELGSRYAHEENYVESKKWYLLAANHGNADAQYELANIYSDEGNSDESKKYYQLAANQGHEKAIYHLKRQERMSELVKEALDNVKLSD